MAENTVKHLEGVEIKSLWGEYDLEWQLNPDVNILIGTNGSGKTTLLELIEIMINERQDKLNDYEFDELKLSFDDEQFIFAEHLYVAELKRFESNYTITSSLQKKFVKNQDGEMKFIKVKFTDFINIEKINTFDMLLYEKEKVKHFIHKEILTELDKILDDLIDEFKDYLLKLRNSEREATLNLDQKIKALSLKETATPEELQELRMTLRDKEIQVEAINQQKQSFFVELTRLFANTEKIADFDKDNSIVFYHRDKKIKLYQLSAGEKQILIILLKVLLQENQPCILLMDEPEISLHVTWQAQLIDIIRKLNPNCQLVIITHAPAIFEHWQDKITKMEDIVASNRHSD